VGQCAAVLTNLAHCAESAAAHTVRCPEGEAELAPRLLADQGRNVAESGCTSITGRTRDCEC
jgi:hypothetical protein